MFLLAWLACIDARDPVAIPVSFEGSDATVELADGTLHLDRAVLELADLRLESPADVAWVPSLVPVAHAHPGHDFAGSIRGELLGVWAVDLLGGEALGVAEAYEGRVATGRFDAYHLSLQGTLQTDTQTLPIAVELPVERIITGIPADADLFAGTPTAMVLRARLDAALRFIDSTDSDGDGVLTEHDEAFANTVLFGITSTDTWILEETP